MALWARQSSGFPSLKWAQVASRLTEAHVSHPRYEDSSSSDDSDSEDTEETAAEPPRGSSSASGSSSGDDEAGGTDPGPPVAPSGEDSQDLESEPETDTQSGAQGR